MTVRRRKRVADSAEQLRAELSAELLSLCESFGVSGSLAPQDVEALRTWLRDAAWSEFPQSVRNLVSRVIVAKRMTRNEYREVYQAVAAASPPSRSVAPAQQFRAAVVVFGALIGLAGLAAVLSGQ
jgi:hypothetical protein